MCDYSLYTFPNRLAREGEDLVAYRFSSGCVGFASAAGAVHPDVTCSTTWLRRKWRVLGPWFFPRKSFGPTAVCLPPGSRLRLDPVSVSLRRLLGLREKEEAVLTQGIADEFRYRDGLRFENGKVIFLQTVPAGQRVRVVSMAASMDWFENELELTGAWL